MVVLPPSNPSLPFNAPVSVPVTVPSLGAHTPWDGSFWTQVSEGGLRAALAEPSIPTRIGRKDNNLVRRQDPTCVGPNTPATCPASAAWCAFASCASTQILVGNGVCPDAYVVAACAKYYSCDPNTNLLIDDGQGFTCQQDFNNLKSCCSNNGGSSGGGSNTGAATGLRVPRTLGLGIAALAGALIVLA